MEFPHHYSHPGIHSSPLGVIPKKNKPVKYCLIVDLSSPASFSTNDGMGVPLEPSKLEGPTTCLTFLGIQIDTKSLLLRLPEEKLSKLKQELFHCILRKSISKRELQSLTGLLQFATKVIQPGRSFLRQLYAMQSIGSHPEHHVRLNAAARADIVWWHLFTEEWNGISILWDSSTVLPEFNIFSDASGSWGCGAVVSFQVARPIFLLFNCC